MKSPAGTARPLPAGRGEAIVLTTVLALAVAAYGWRPGLLGWGNPYYSAVAQSGAGSWKAFFFATPDLLAATGTDKPPLAFWPMAASVHLFGLHGWAVMAPQVVETLATVLVLHLTVRRVAGPAAGLVAAAVLATTPVTFTLARFDDPDTLLTLWVTIGACAAVRAAAAPERRRWLVVLGASLGCAFLTKWLAALVPAPALVAAAVWSRLPDPARPWRLRKAPRVWRGLAVVGVTGSLAGLWWVVAVVLTPASVRPFPDSRTGSIVDVILNQNGLDRFSYAPASTSAVAVKGLPGPLRLVTAPFAAQTGWLLPLAGVVVAAGLLRWWRRDRAPAAGGVALGGWFVLTVAVFSLMGGAMHPYYTVLLAPATAGLVGIGAAWLWRRRYRAVATAVGRWAVALMMPLTGGYAAWILWPYPGLRVWAVLAAFAGAAAGTVLGLLTVPWRTGGRLTTATRAGWAAAAALSCLAAVTGPAAFAVSTATHPVTGANPVAGPSQAVGGGERYPAVLVGSLVASRPRDGWVAAVITATPASRLQLQTGEPVLPVGGFTGQSGGPTLALVQTWVRQGRLRYLVLTGPFGGRAAQPPPGAPHTVTGTIVRWALDTGCPVTVTAGGPQVVDLRPPTACAGSSSGSVHGDRIAGRGREAPGTTAGAAPSSRQGRLVGAPLPAAS